MHSLRTQIASEIGNATIRHEVRIAMRMIAEWNRKSLILFIVDVLFGPLIYMFFGDAANVANLFVFIAHA